MRKSQTRIVLGPQLFVHERTTNARGQVVPACGARLTSRDLLDIRVTANTGRVTCEKCRAMRVRAA